ISRHNMNDLENIAELLLDDIGISSISNNEASPIGAGCTYESEVALDHIDTLRVGLQLEKLQEKYPGRIIANAGPLAKLRMYREMEDTRKTGQVTERWKMGFLSSCGGVFSKLGILHDGSIVPCSMLHDLTMGNMLTDDILDVWRNSPVIKEVRDRYVVPLSKIRACSNCEWVNYCNGGCPGITQQIQKTLLEPNWRVCYSNFLKANGIRSIYDAVDRKGELE
ncbi:MAG: SPASM domain-containing protein, partial [Candidatus Aegiribacteria sp.]|nr:SPASM domain-containing protein [Candidatus Aegiribacteria sp.]